MGSFFLFNRAFQHVETTFPNVFESDGIKKGDDSELKQFGWYAQIVSIAATATAVSEVEQMNLYQFMRLLAVKIAENRFVNSLYENQ